MDIIEIKNFKNGPLATDLKIKRMNRTTVSIYGTLTLNEDLSGIEVLVYINLSLVIFYLLF